LADRLVDTDVLIDHLRGAVRLHRPVGVHLNYSVISRCELVAGPESQQGEVIKLLASLNPIPVDERVADAAGLIRRETGIATPDALIAATAIGEGLELMTRNIRDFERVEGLRLASVAT
jgi:predicted nucleic acid-binding protein